ncbi:MAG: SAM-dependent methyltransferase [bacterium]|nr:SAM-dependent methyltransferase [bacterium]
MTEMTDYRDEIRRLVLDETSFVQLTLKGKVREGAQTPWRMIAVRPVLVKDRRHLQFIYYDAKQSFTKNYVGDEAVRKLDEALAIPYSAIHARTIEQDVSVQITKKGKPIFHYAKTHQEAQPELTHDRAKALPLPADQPDVFLQGVGIMTAQGSVRPEMRDKFHQINEFLKLLEHSGELERLAESGEPLEIVDFGCGSAHLTLAAYHYLNDIKGIPARLTGIDRNAALINKNISTADKLGFRGARFYAGDIADYPVLASGQRPPDIVLALHACDTATDDVLAQAVLSGAKLIFAAPCCHHDLHEQIEAVEPFRPVLRHGILKKRMGDILTDSFRALVLRICGYKADVIEFISAEHTDRNLMIRAVLREHLQHYAADNAEFIREYQALKDFWGVVPYIERLLGKETFEEGD